MGTVVRDEVGEPEAWVVFFFFFLRVSKYSMFITIKAKIGLYSESTLQAVEFSFPATHCLLQMGRLPPVFYSTAKI